MPKLQRLHPGHAPAVLAFELANRSYFAAFVSDRGDEFFDQFTEQHSALLAEQEASPRLLRARRRGRLSPGRFNLYDVEDGTAVLGYRVAEHVAGRGLATATVRELCRLAAAQHGLHTLRAATSRENTASQKVLTKAGFVPAGPADPAHLGGKQGTWYQRDRPAGAILGFANLLLRLYREEAPRAVLVGWDTYEAPTYRHEQFAAYQSGREFDDDLIEQLAVIPDLVAACGFANAKGVGYEADDFLAAAATAEERRGGRALVASGDRDTFQLASEHTTILYPVRGQGMARIGPAEVRARYGVDPAQVPDFIALRGDPFRQAAGRAGRRRHRRGNAPAQIREPRRHPQGRPLRQTGRGFAALSLDRHHEPQGAIAAARGSKAGLG